jgi:hypothetical protein
MTCKIAFSQNFVILCLVTLYYYEYIATILPNSLLPTFHQIYKHPQTNKHPKDDIWRQPEEQRHVQHEKNDSNGLQQSLLQPQENDVVFKQQQQKQQQQQH